MGCVKTKSPRQGMLSSSSIPRILQERYVTPIHCTRCSKTWPYSGKNKYVASCPTCRSKLSIRKNCVRSAQPEGRQAIQADVSKSIDANPLPGKEEDRSGLK